MTIKKPLTVFLSCLLLSSTTQSDSQAPIKLADMSSKNLQVPPYTWLDTCEKERTGSMRHIINRSFAKAGLPIQWVSYENAAISNYQQFQEKQYQRMLNGEIDMIVMTPQKETNPLLQIGKQPLYKVKYGVITTNTLPPITSIKQLSNYHGSALTSSKSLASAKLVALLPKLVIADDFLLSIHRLSKGELDYIIGDRFVLQSFLKRLGMNGEVNNNDLVLGGTEFYLATTKDNPYKDKLPAIDSVLRQFQKQGYTEHVHQTYLNKWISTKGCH